MNAWRRWLQRPQSLGSRKALVQLHLWLGLGAGLYILLISVSGSAIVFRRELVHQYSRRPLVVAAAAGTRIGLDELRLRLERTHPGYEVYSIAEPVRPDRPAEAILGNRRERISRLVDPYTGADLGDTRSRVDRDFQWLADFHYNLLAGATGRWFNGIGACVVTVLALSGIVIWWPGVGHCRRGMNIRWTANFARFNWDLHSATGFWCFLLVLIWGMSGIFLCFPGVLTPVVSSTLVSWINRLHFGRFSWFTQILWTLLGLAPAVLFITGALMWWNRVLRKALPHRSRKTIAARIA
jgi:uncharacterized iron-regulated membrane protein